jgi:hypothetical protein
MVNEKIAGSELAILGPFLSVMERKDLTKIFDKVFVPSGFKKKGNYWVNNKGEVTKIINLQKSNFSNLYYVNWGYILKSIPLENLLMHIFNRLTSVDAVERERINRLLDLENEIPDEERSEQVKVILTDKLLVDIQSVNSEADLLKELQSGRNPHTIPGFVKSYFGLA